MQIRQSYIRMGSRGPAGEVVWVKCEVLNEGTVTNRQTKGLIMLRVLQLIDHDQRTHVGSFSFHHSDGNAQ